VSDRARLALFLVGAAGTALLYAWGIAGLPAFGHYPGPYGDVLNTVELGERHATNVVASVVFDYRSLDTMGEELILFASAIAVAVLLRLVRERRAPSFRGRVGSDALRWIGALSVPLVTLLGLDVVAHGYLTPGGGFQGGVVLAGALLLLSFAGEYRLLRKAAPEQVLDLFEGAAAGAYIVIGIVGMVAGAAFLDNVLPLGTPGSLASTGTIALLNWVVAVEVAAAMLLIGREYLEEVVRGGES
jgi:multicomponent Na+:H+ antiporter subunit B